MENDLKDGLVPRLPEVWAGTPSVGLNHTDQVESFRWPVLQRHRKMGVLTPNSLLWDGTWGVLGHLLITTPQYESRAVLDRQSTRSEPGAVHAPSQEARILGPQALVVYP